ncbi:MAG: cytochrome b [Cellvibrionaceae bacterium]
MKKILLINSQDYYGWIAISIHWLSVLFIIGLFFLGITMVELDYYSPWYHKAPFIHKSLGLLFAFLLLLRIIWRVLNQTPNVLSQSKGIRRLSHWVHISFYFLMGFLVISGYLIASADDKAIEVFNWFSIPGFNLGIENQEDIAGEMHEIIGWIIIILGSLHASMALKHHFVDKDATLRRMLGL